MSRRGDYVMREGAGAAGQSVKGDCAKTRTRQTGRNLTREAGPCVDAECDAAVAVDKCSRGPQKKTEKQRAPRNRVELAARTTRHCRRFLQKCLQ